MTLSPLAMGHGPVTETNGTQHGLYNSLKNLVYYNDVLPNEYAKLASGSSLTARREHNPPAKRKGTNKNTDDHQAYRPFESLPLELLAIVFELMQGPWLFAFEVLCRVNRLWRAVALSAPALWTTLSVKGKRCTAGTVSLWRHFLHCSTNRPLLVFAGRLLGSPYDKDIIALLVAHAHRVEKLVMVLVPQSIDLLSAFPCGALGGLQELDLKVQRKQWSDAVMQPPHGWQTAFTQLPKLTSLSVYFAGTSHSAADCPFPWQNLCVLDISEGRSLTNVLPVLARCINLTRFTLVALTNCWPPVGIHPAVQLPRLTFMEFLCHPDASAGTFLGHITAPCLTSLCICLDPPMYEDDNELCSRGAKSLICSALLLESLWLINLGMDGEDTVEWLYQVPQLRVLSLTMLQIEHECSIVDEDVLEALTRRAGCPESLTVLPKLQELTLSMANDTHLGAQLLGMLESRWGPSAVGADTLARLLQVRVEFEYTAAMRASEWARFDALADAGMALSWEYHDQDGPAPPTGSECDRGNDDIEPESVRYVLEG